MKKYSIIYADPPWSYRNGKGHPRWAAEVTNHYSTMTLEDIKSLPVQGLADENCMLFMWVTFPNLKEGLETIDSWGFKYKTLAFSWLKLDSRFAETLLKLLKKIDGKDGVLEIIQKLFFFGVGYYTKSNCEVCLIGVKGKPIKESNRVSSVLLAPRGKHSEKPPIVRDKIIELCGDIPRVELFARQATPGWDVWGNEVASTIEL